MVEFLCYLPRVTYKLSTGMALRETCYFTFTALLSFFRNLSLFSRETSRLVCFFFWPLSTPLMLILGSTRPVYWYALWWLLNVFSAYENVYPYLCCKIVDTVTPPLFTPGLNISKLWVSSGKIMAPDSSTIPLCWLMILYCCDTWPFSIMPTYTLLANEP